jgi:hypothetical protein
VTLGLVSANDEPPLVSESSALNRATAFVNFLSGYDLLTVKSFYKAYGNHSEFEISAEMDYCQIVLKQSYDDCLGFHKERYFDAENSISYYLDWLRSLIPKGQGKLLTNSSRFERFSENQCWYNFVFDVHGTLVELKANSCSISLELGGEVSVTSINNEVVMELWDEYSP